MFFCGTVHKAIDDGGGHIPLHRSSAKYFAVALLLAGVRGNPSLTRETRLRHAGLRHTGQRQP